MRSERCIDSRNIQRFELQLREAERSEGTIDKYLRDIQQFGEWLGERELTKDVVRRWKEELVESGYKPVTVNGKIAGINCFFEKMGWPDLKVKALRIQRKIFRDKNRELTKEEYERLVREAECQGNRRLALLMETICSTGIRVSELKYVTVESIAEGKAEIHLKGKIRVILFSGKLCRKLSKYCKERHIKTGEVFITRNKTPLSRKQIWAEMKRVCRIVGVEETKVFPHNLRHLFARCFYKVCRDIVKLADVLGHSSIETTRIYLISSGEEHIRAIERLRLIS